MSFLSCILMFYIAVSSLMSYLIHYKLLENSIFYIRYVICIYFNFNFYYFFCQFSDSMNIEPWSFFESVDNRTHFLTESIKLTRAYRIYHIADDGIHFSASQMTKSPQTKNLKYIFTFRNIFLCSTLMNPKKL